MRLSVLELGTTWAQLPPPTRMPSGGGRPVLGPITVTSPSRLGRRPPQEPMAQLRRAHSSARAKEQPHQRYAHGQQPPEQGQLHISDSPMVTCACSRSRA